MITQSLLDTDLYTFSVGMAAHQIAPTAQAKFEFKCRNEDVVFDGLFEIRFERALKTMNGLRFTASEIRYLRSLKHFSEAYLQYLSNFTFRSSAIQWSVVDGKLSITIDGTWADRMIYEVPVLFTINECYFNDQASLNEGRSILNDKIKQIKSADNKPCFVEFGTRRRYSFAWQAEVVQTLARELPENIHGTSNVFLAKALGLQPIGTQSHQWYQAFQALVPVHDSLRSALDFWLLVHRGRFATALTDIVGSEAFYKRLDPLHWKAFDGFRGDSGDNRWWLNLTHKSALDAGVDPTTKRVYLSNGLDVPECLELNEDYHDAFKNVTYAIGTKFTNHFSHKALNIVIKMTELNGAPVAKLSDDPSKGMCKSGDFLSLLQKTFA